MMTLSYSDQRGHLPTWINYRHKQQ